MVSFKIKNKDYKIEFKHIYRGFNVCTCIISEIIIPKEKFQVINNGEARMSKKDMQTKTYCKAYGRKIALKKALLKRDFDKYQRTEIWSEYFKVCKP